MSKVTVVLELQDKASRGLKKFGSEAKKAGQTAAEKFKSVKMELLKVTAVLTAAGIAAKGMWDLASRGVEVRRAEQALEGYAGGAREAAAALEAVQTATDGAVSRTSAMGMAAKLLAMNLATNADEAGRLAEIAVTLGASMGIGPEAAFERFTLLLANQSILRLDTFGISATSVRDRMQSLVQEGMEPADRQGRFLTATLEQAEIKMQALAEAGFDASSSMDQAASAWEDFKDEVAVGVMEVVEPAAGAVLTLGDFADMTRRVRAAGYEMVSLWYLNAAGQDKMTAALQEMENAAVPALNVIAAMAREEERLAIATAEAVDAEEELAYSLSDVNMALGEVTTAMLYQKAAAGLDEEASLALARSMGILNEESWVQISVLNALSAQLESGAIFAGEYASKVGDVTFALSNLRAAQVGVTPTTLAAELAGMAVWRGEMGGLPTDIPRRQRGGEVEGAGAYLVGEAGPELFVPGSSGGIWSFGGGRTVGQRGGVPFSEPAQSAGQVAVLQKQVASLPAQVGSQVAQQIITQQVAGMRQAQAASDRIMSEMRGELQGMNLALRDLPRRFAKEITSAITQTMG